MKKEQINVMLKSFLIVGMVSLLTNCNTNESCADLGTCPTSGIVERTDIVVEGDFSLSDHQLTEQGFNGPVDFEFDTDPSTFTIVLHLSDGSDLTINMFNSAEPDPWDDVDVSYHVYPAQEMASRAYFVKATLTKGGDAAAYSTHLGSAIPSYYMLDAFRITSIEDGAIRARIKDLVLTKNVEPGKTIVVNGTFTGIVDGTLL